MDFDRICTALHLGVMTAVPRPLSGGFTHRMYALSTTKGQYAVKLLNPEIMQRPTALGNFAAAEALEARLEAQGLPILPALVIGERKMQCVAGQYLYVFEYFPGKPLTDREILPAHCRCMGTVLARIHAIAQRTLPGPAQRPAPIDWAKLAENLLADREAHAEGMLMQAALPMLTQVTAASDEAILHLPRIEAVCHNDMDPKNVLWQGTDFRVIDLECLGYANPMQELLDLAVTWSGQPLHEDRFRALIGAYAAAGGTLPGDVGLLFDSRRNYLEWLAYNAARALGEDATERRIGLEQVRETLGKIRGDLSVRERVVRWMEA